MEPASFAAAACVAGAAAPLDAPTAAGAADLAICCGAVGADLGFEA